MNTPTTREAAACIEKLGYIRDAIKPLRAFDGMGATLDLAIALLAAPEPAGADRAAALDAAPPAEVGSDKRAVIRRMNFCLWMAGNGGCEPPADWQGGYLAGMEAAEPSPEVGGLVDDGDDPDLHDFDWAGIGPASDGDAR